MTFLLLHLGLQLAVADQVRKAELFVWGAGNVYVIQKHGKNCLNNERL